MSPPGALISNFRLRSSVPGLARDPILAKMAAFSAVRMSSESSHLPPPVHYWQDKRGTGSPLCAIREQVRGTPLPLSSDDLAALTARTGLPEAAVHRASEYYRPLAARTRGARLMVCQGTACRQAGAVNLRARLEKQKLPCHGVPCLGYCDKAPALLDERDSAFAGEEAARFDTQRGFSQSVLGLPLPRLSHATDSPLILPRLLQGGARSLEEAQGKRVYEGLRKALSFSPEDMLTLVRESGLSGSEGRVAPLWETCAATAAEDRYVIGHAHAGSAGAVVDRLLLEHDPHAVLEGLILAGRAIGASHGILFVPSEYPQALRHLEAAIRDAHAAGFLGRDILGSSWSFQVSLFPGAGRYAGSEPTVLIDAIESLRGEARPRPPAPEVGGLYRLPTLVQPVEVLAQLGQLALVGSGPWLRQGTTACPGTRVLCLNSGFVRPGLVEVPHGGSLRDLVLNHGGGVAKGEPMEALLVGGLEGSLLLPDEWDLPLCPAAFAERGLRLGNGSLVPITASADHRDLLSHWLEHMDGESCGKCTPCRLGPAGIVGLAARYERLATVESRPRDATRARRDMETLFTAMEMGSLCAFGQNVPRPMRRFVDAFWNRIFAPRS